MKRSEKVFILRETWICVLKFMEIHLSTRNINLVELEGKSEDHQCPQDTSSGDHECHMFFCVDVESFYWMGGLDENLDRLVKQGDISWDCQSLFPLIAINILLVVLVESSNSVRAMNVWTTVVKIFVLQLTCWRLCIREIRGLPSKVKDKDPLGKLNIWMKLYTARNLFKRWGIPIKN